MMSFALTPLLAIEKTHYPIGYLVQNFGNIDVEWWLQFDLVVNQYVKANIGMHLIYEDDVKTIEEVNGQNVESGTKTQ